MWNCIDKIPGAMEDEKLKSIFKYSDPLWYFGVDESAPRDYNDEVRPKDPYRDHWQNDPLYRKDWTKSRDQLNFLVEPIECF